MAELRAACEIVADDYHEFNRMERRRKRWRIWGPTIVFELLIIVGAVAARKPDALTFLLVFPGFIGFMIVASRAGTNLMLKRTPSALGRVEWRVDEVGVHATDRSGALTLNWSVFTAVELGPKLIALRISPYFARFIPRRAFESPDTESEFIALAQRRISGR